MKKRDIQILMVAFLFLSMTLLINPSSLSIIQPERTIGDSPVTVGDSLTFFALLGSSVTIGLWLTSILKKRESD